MTENLARKLPEFGDEFDQANNAPTRITIPYNPRVHFLSLHNSPKRFIFIVAHRRAGKTVALCNKVIRAALENRRTFPPPRYSYVGPSFAQAKDLVWGYFKHYTSVLPDLKINEGDLQITLPNSAQINLYGGAQAYERMRGLYFDGAVLDEFPLLNPAAWSSVVRPCLADYKGWAVVSGTSNGDDHFHALKKKADLDPDWDVFSIPVTNTDALDPDEVVDMTKDMSPEEYAREMLCSFEAPVEGAYFAAYINDLQAKGQLTGVPHDNAAQVITWWDLGMDDDTVVWYVQLVGREIHVIDCDADRMKGIDWWVDKVKSKRYNYACHIMPHDVKAHEMGTGKSRYEQFLSLLGNIVVCPFHRVEDGISAVRNVLPMCWIDRTRCEHGISALRAYHSTKNGHPAHDWASHPADAFRTGAVGMNIAKTFMRNSGVIIPFAGAIRRKIRGLCR